VNSAFLCIQRAAFGQQLHRPLAAEVHRGTRVKPSRASSGTPSPAADQTPLHDIAPQRPRPSGPVTSYLTGGLHTTHPAADQKPLLLTAALSSVSRARQALLKAVSMRKQSVWSFLSRHYLPKVIVWGLAAVGG